MRDADKERRRQTFRLIEAELMCYPATKEALRKLSAELLDVVTLPSTWPRIESIRVRYVDATGREVEEELRGVVPTRSEGRISDPTPLQAERLANLRHSIENSTCIMEAVRRVVAVEDVLETLRLAGDREKLALIDMRYFRRLPDERVMSELHISPRTFRRWRREVVGMVAARLGWQV